jgi:hypothetical protein
MHKQSDLVGSKRLFLQAAELLFPRPSSAHGLLPAAGRAHSITRRRRASAASHLRGSRRHGRSPVEDTLSEPERCIVHRASCCGCGCSAARRVRLARPGTRIATAGCSSMLHHPGVAPGVPAALIQAHLCRDRRRCIAPHSAVVVAYNNLLSSSVSHAAHIGPAVRNALFDVTTVEQSHATHGR